MKVLLSIKPEYVEKIFSGKKQFEYRKSIFKKNVDTIIIYATMPIGKIVGEFQIDSILYDSPQGLWEKTKEQSGISSEYFYDYFKHKEIAYAIKIKNVIKYHEERDPYRQFANFVAPQSFRYLSNEL